MRRSFQYTLRCFHSQQDCDQFFSHGVTKYSYFHAHTLKNAEKAVKRHLKNFAVIILERYGRTVEEYVRPANSVQFIEEL